MLSVALRVVAITVVKEDLGVARAAGQASDVARPLGELVVGIAITEPLVDVLAVPVI